jgi:hypothetical protein
MSEQQLRNQEVFPTDNVIANALSKSYAAYQAFIASLDERFPALSLEWRYYKDGKAWLCKGAVGKKTVFWVSVWEGFFRLAFYFTEKTKSGVMELPIDEAIKIQLQNAALVGKLIPLIIDVRKTEQLSDLLTVLEYKAGLR